jgi:hypothetical protein
VVILEDGMMGRDNLFCVTFESGTELNFGSVRFCGKMQLHQNCMHEAPEHHYHRVAVFWLFSPFPKVHRLPSGRSLPAAVAGHVSVEPLIYYSQIQSRKDQCAHKLTMFGNGAAGSSDSGHIPCQPNHLLFYIYY